MIGGSTRGSRGGKLWRSVKRGRGFDTPLTRLLNRRGMLVRLLNRRGMLTRLLNRRGMLTRLNLRVCTRTRPGGRFVNVRWAR